MAGAAGEGPLPMALPARRTGAGEWLAVLLRGIAMGVAELVPGVSGGTIAFVTGIYEELVATLAGLQPRSLAVLYRQGPRSFWASHNLTFLLVLGTGMLAAVVLFARLLGYLLDRTPTLVWGFFFGLIAASVVHIGRYRAARALAGYGPLGAVLGLGVLELSLQSGDAPLWMFFLGGVVAVSAWLLPAVSGSFLLLALGLYEPVLRAFNAGHWLIPATLAAGCVVGLLVFSRFLHWLMRRAREPVLATLTGFMAISLVRLWPWQHAGALLTPGGYEAATGQGAGAPGVLAAAAIGVLALWLLSRLE